MRARPNCVSLEGLDPSGKGTREFWVEKDLIQFFYKKGWLHKFHSLHSVKEILAQPSVIFRGLGREGQEEALATPASPRTHTRTKGIRPRRRPDRPSSSTPGTTTWFSGGTGRKRIEI